MRLALIVVLALVAGACSAQRPGRPYDATSWPSCNGTANTLPVWSDEAVFVASVPNGIRYLAGVAPYQLHLVHLYGTPYEMGYAYGSLFKDELPLEADAFHVMANTQITEFCQQDIPDLVDLCKVFEQYGLFPFLDLYAEVLTTPHTSQVILDEIKGLSDASGYPYLRVLGMNVIPDIIKAGCSMIGAWGPTIPSTDLLHQLRCLWLDPNTTIQAYPTMVVYHPTPGSGYEYAHVNVGFLGVVGVFSGISEADIALSEKAYNGYPGKSSRSGNPWPYVLRNVLGNAATAEQATQLMAASQRTCSIFVGVGAAQIGNGETYQFVQCNYSYEFLDVFDDANVTTYMPTHPRIPGLIWLTEINQPDTTVVGQCYLECLETFMGNLTAYNMAKFIAPVVQTGGLHTVSFDFAAQEIYVANAGYPQTGPLDGPSAAYNRGFLRFDLPALYAQQPPSSAS